MIRALLAISAFRTILFVALGTHVIAFAIGRWIGRGSRAVHVHYDERDSCGSHPHGSRGSRPWSLDDRVGAVLRVVLVIAIAYIVIEYGHDFVSRP